MTVVWLYTCNYWICSIWIDNPSELVLIKVAVLSERLQFDDFELNSTSYHEKVFESNCSATQMVDHTIYVVTKIGWGVGVCYVQLFAVVAKYKNVV